MANPNERVEPVAFRPCPFCGGVGKYRSVNLPKSFDPTVAVECHSCGARGSIADVEVARALWNQRVRPIASEEAIEAAAREISDRLFTAGMIQETERPKGR